MTYGLMNEANYDKLPAVRRSELWEIRKSPAHYLYAATHKEPPTTALLFGTAAHKYILERQDFWNCYVLAPEVDRRTKDGKAAWSQFQQNLEETGKEAITVSDYEVIVAMDNAIMTNPTAKELLKSGSHEVPFIWTESTTHEECKCRVDTITDEYIIDYKTTTSCEPGAFERSCRSYGYKLQAAMYADGVFSNTFETRKFAFVAQEKKPPYAVRVYFCDQGFIDEGMDIFRELIGIYHKCKESGKWPGYEDQELYGDE